MDTYEKKYKDALERARNYHKQLLDEDNPEWASEIEKIFPELAESEDERIRKKLISLVKNWDKGGIVSKYTSDANEIKLILVWLEKQEGCEYIKKDWLEHIKQSWYKEGFIDGKYTPKEWTINDATTLNELIDFLENGTVKLQHDLTLYANWLKTQFSPIEKQGEERKITHEEICKSYGIPDIGEFSDGYHTFNGLYKQRMILFAVLVKTYKDRAWKSWKHEDGLDCFGGGWFIVGIDTPAGTYTYHYEAKDWDKFDCQILEKAKHWDGHDEFDVERLFSLVSNANKDEVIRCLINGMKFYYEDNAEATWGTEKFSMKVKDILSWLEKQNTEMKDVISMDVNSETEWDDIHKFLRMNLDGEKVKLLIIREE